MAFTKITNADFNNKGALSMPTRPSETKSAHEIQRLFDAPAREVVAPAYNRLIDELEAETGAASLGAVAPTGASGNTVQEILNGVYGAISTAVVDVREIKEEIETLSETVEEVTEKAHTHSNKELLDTYEQAESDLADAVSKKHAHSNKALLDTYNQTNDNLSDAVAKKHTHDNKSLLDTYEQTEANLADAVSKKHSHSNKSVLDKFGESGGKPTYDGSTISGAVDSVNGQTGAVVLDASDVGALPSSTDIPDSLSDLSDDSTHRLVTDTEKTTWNGKSVVSVTQVQTTGNKLATITVNGTGTDIYSPQGTGTGDMLASDYDSDLAVKTAGGIKAFVNAQISAQITSALTASY